MLPSSGSLPSHSTKRSTPRITFPTLSPDGEERTGAELERARTEHSFCVPRADIVATDYDLSINRYSEVVYSEVEYASPAEILDNLAALEAEIHKGIEDLRAMLK